jgi:hypothetical protein
MRSIDKVMSMAIAGVLFCGLQAANATPILTVSDGTTTKIIVDQGPGDRLDDPTEIGQVLFSGPVGNWAFNVDTGVTKPALGSADSASMDLTIRHLKVSAAGTLTISWYDDGFTALGDMVAMIDGNQTIGSGVTITYKTYYGDATHVLDPSVISASDMLITSSPTMTSIQFTDYENGVLGSLTPYSLKQVITITTTKAWSQNDVMSADATLTKVPDGGVTAMLLGIVLVGMGSLKRIFRA